MFEPASHHLLIVLVSVLLLIAHMLRFDERAAAPARSRRGNSARPRHFFSNSLEHDKDGLIPLADPDGHMTHHRSIRR